MIEKIYNSFELQETMNSLVNPDWKRKRFPFSRAAWVEMAEALSATNWKWWKHTEVDQYQLKLEMVDIYHFMVSDGILGNVTPVTVQNLWKTASSKFPIFQVGDIEVIFKHGETFISEGALGRLNWREFFDTMLALGIDFDEVLTMYVAKNTLNIFRQRNGYKDGSYIKEWFGEEDNKTLEKIMTASPNILQQDLFNELEKAYSLVLQQHII